MPRYMNISVWYENLTVVHRALTKLNVSVNGQNVYLVFPKNKSIIRQIRIIQMGSLHCVTNAWLYGTSLENILAFFEICLASLGEMFA